MWVTDCCESLIKVGMRSGRKRSGGYAVAVGHGVVNKEIDRELSIVSEIRGIRDLS